MKKIILSLKLPITFHIILVLFLSLTGCNASDPLPVEATVAVATPLPTFTASPVLPTPTATPPTAAPSPTPEPPPASPTATPLAAVRQGDTLQLPSPTPTPTPPPGLACLVQTEALNLREGPGPSYQVIETLASGSSVSALKAVAGGAWILIQTAGPSVGWVRADLVSCQGDMAGLPIATGITAQPASAAVAAATPAALPPTATPAPAQPADTPTPPAPASPPVGRWRGEYYDNASLLGEPVLIREDATLDFNWLIDSPAPGIPTDNFSVRWTGIFDFAQTGDYRFHASVDDGIRLYLDGWLVIDAWHTSLPIDYFGVFEDVQAGPHTVVVEYFESGGHARIRVWNEYGEFAGGDWVGDYFDNRDFRDPIIFTENTDEIDFDWDDDAPHDRLDDDRFSVRWRRTVHFEPGDYRFFAELEEEDRVRVTIDGWEVIDEGRDSSGRVEGRFENMGGGNHTVVVEFVERGGDAGIEFWWDKED